MTKSEYLALAEERWPELEALEAKGDFYAYEQRFVEIMKELEQSILQAHLGKTPSNHRKKSPSKPRSGK
ncbi:MAG: hypothetical protein AAF927_31500 [Bacteroidota bacterium]